jgi:hypothetical protein
LADGSKHVLSTRRQLSHHCSSFKLSMKTSHPIIAAMVGAEVMKGDIDVLGEKLGRLPSLLVDIWNEVTLFLCFSEGLRTLWRKNVSSSGPNIASSGQMALQRTLTVQYVFRPMPDGSSSVCSPFIVTFSNFLLSH